jgi:hypothetical protein
MVAGTNGVLLVLTSFVYFLLDVKHVPMATFLSAYHADSAESSYEAILGSSLDDLKAQWKGYLSRALVPAITDSPSTVRGPQ